MDTSSEVLREREWTAGPVDEALKAGISELEILIYAAGGDDLMSLMCDREMDKSESQHRGAILGSARDRTGNRGLARPKNGSSREGR